MTRHDRRQALTDALVAAAEARIARDGFATLKARDVASDAGVALGSIYTAFRDMDELKIAVNARTFRALAVEVRRRLEALGPAAPVDRLIEMANAYMDFAETNMRRWEALFTSSFSVVDVPAWYVEEVEGLLSIIADPVRDLRPDLDDRQAGLLARGLFGSVHGIVLLSVQNRVAALPPGETRRIMEMMLRAATQRPPSKGDATST